MRKTREGIDYVVINEDTIESYDPSQKIHLIELAFKSPTKSLVKRTVERYALTNRYVIKTDVQFYNSVLRRTGKKYYVANNESDRLITFFRRNNKVLLDLDKLTKFDYEYVTGEALSDLLSNCEVIAGTDDQIKALGARLNEWRGNAVVRS